MCSRQPNVVFIQIIFVFLFFSFFSSQWLTNYKKKFPRAYMKYLLQGFQRNHEQTKATEFFFCKMELRNMTAIKWKSGTWPLCEKQYLVNKLLKGFWQQSFLLRLLRKIKSILQWKWKRKLRHQLLLSQGSSFAKWLSVRLQTKRLWVRMPLLSHKQFEI